MSSPSGMTSFGKWDLFSSVKRGVTLTSEMFGFYETRIMESMWEK